MRNLFFALLLSLMPIFSQAQAKYSDVQVDEESSLNLTKITSDNEYVIMPEVKKGWGGQFYWYTNSVIDVSKDGQQLAYLSLRNKESNIFVKDLTINGASIQRTNRKCILDLSYSPDGEFLCFSEPNGNTIQVYQTNAKAGYVCRQITSGNFDYTPIYSPDIFVSSIDGSNLIQLTYHPADDISPVWGKDGKSIFFISQRGSSKK